MNLTASLIAVSCYKEAVQFSASFVASLPIFDEICGTSISFVFFVWIILKL